MSEYKQVAFLVVSNWLVIAEVSNANFGHWETNEDSHPGTPLVVPKQLHFYRLSSS